MKQNYLIELIDRASAEAGNDSKLAKLIESSPQAISDWRNERKKCPPADQALMASLAGLDADAWAARAVIEQHRGTAKGAKLEAALKKALALTGAALASSSAVAGPAIKGAQNCLEYFIRCILC
jgi:hypothetical protein